MSNQSEAANKLMQIRQDCVSKCLSNPDHYGFLLEFLVIQIAGLRDSIESLKPSEAK